MRRWKRAWIAVVCASLTAVTAGGCGQSDFGMEAATEAASSNEKDGAEGVKLVFWHYYNDAQKKRLDQLIDEYNGSEGAAKNVTVEAFSQGSIDDLTRRIDLVLNESSNEVEMANMFLAYRDMVVNVVKNHPDKLLDFASFLPEEELSQYNEDYLEEGYIAGKLYTLPVAKSTELLLMNQPRLDEFLGANPQYKDEDMADWGGLEQMAQGYFEWTDSMTPDIEGDGSPFIGLDNLPNYFIVMNHAMGSSIYYYDESGKLVLDLNQDYIKRLFLNYYEPFTKGYYGANGKYRSDDVKQSFLAGYIGSSSSVLYFPDQVADSEGNMVPIECGVYPYPVMEGTDPTAIQQGAGVAVFNRGEAENKACLDFIHWLTIEKGFDLASSMSYMPVKRAELTSEQEEAVENNKVLMGIKVGLGQSSSYKMVYGFDFENAYNVRTGIGECMSDMLSQGRQEFLGYLEQGLTMEEAAQSMDYEAKADDFYEKIMSEFGQ